MADLIEIFSNAVDSTCTAFIDGGVVLTKGIMRASDEISCTLHDVYCLQGFEKWNKATSSNLKALSNCTLITNIFPIKGIFDGLINELKSEQDLFYATQVFDSTAKLFEKDRENSGYRLATNIQWVDICYAIGNPLETLQFLQRHDVISYPMLSNIASQVGSIHLFNMNGQAVHFSDVPVINALVNKPKDFFVFLASSLGAYKGLKDFDWEGIKNFDSKSLENLCKLASNIGRVILIPFGSHLHNSGWIGVLTVVDLVTQNTSLFAFIIKRRSEREKSFEDRI